MRDSEGFVIVKSGYKFFLIIKRWSSFFDFLNLVGYVVCFGLWVFSKRVVSRGFESIYVWGFGFFCCFGKFVIVIV